jgi:hypothetical protein
MFCSNFVWLQIEDILQVQGMSLCLCFSVLKEHTGSQGATSMFQIALASFYEDGGDEDIVTISQATPSSVSRGTAPR